MDAHRQTQHIRWGILGVANIAMKKVIPALQSSRHSRVVAIASRTASKARDAAAALGIPRAYGSYEELLGDGEIDAIYNPLPNHLHVPWTIRAAEAGKHVLCEKPIAMSADEARTLIAARDRTGVQIAEAFMVHVHPQWDRVRELIGSGRIGELRLVSTHFSYYRRDPSNIRSRVDYGGGALMDIGCYPITMSRRLFGGEPVEVIADIDRDAEHGIDRLTSAMLRFPGGQATFSCAGQLVPHQRMQIFGTTGRIEVEIPFNTPADRPARLLLDDGSSLAGEGVVRIEVPAADQYVLQGDAFVAAIRREGPVPSSVEDGVANMAVIDALFRSGESRQWERVARP